MSGLKPVSCRRCHVYREKNHIEQEHALHQKCHRENGRRSHQHCQPSESHVELFQTCEVQADSNRVAAVCLNYFGEFDGEPQQCSMF